jgi:uncharacterized membrane protein
VLAVKPRRFVPPRISHLLGIVAAVALVWSVIDGVLLSSLLRVADRSFQELDALIQDDLPRPPHPDQTGSQASLINWEDLGGFERSILLLVTPTGTGWIDAA